VSSLDASRIKSKLINQYFNQEEPKSLFSAPKTRLQTFLPTEDKLSAASEIGGLLRQKRSTAPAQKPVFRPPEVASKNELPRPEVFQFKERVEPATYKSPYAHIQESIL
jgi:hypothetical protein